MTDCAPDPELPGNPSKEQNRPHVHSAQALLRRTPPGRGRHGKAPCVRGVWAAFQRGWPNTRPRWAQPSGRGGLGAGIGTFSLPRQGRVTPRALWPSVRPGPLVTKA